MACGYEKQSTTITDVRPGDMREIYMGEGKNKKKMADNAERYYFAPDLSFRTRRYIHVRLSRCRQSDGCQYRCHWPDE